jgi:predicted nucleic acid-binding protein
LAEIFIDTSYVVALVNSGDQYHDHALEIADSVNGRDFITTDGILLEIGNALSRNFKRESVEIIEHFLSSDDVRVIHLQPTLFRSAFDLYKSHADKLWGLVDCLSFVIMKELGITEVLTTDKHFEQAGFRSLMKR